MFGLRDFYHLPQVETLVDQIAAGGPGLVVVAGPDAHPQPGRPPGAILLPSGRSAVFGMLVDRLLAGHPGAKAQVIAPDKETYRPPRSFKRRVRFNLVQPPFTYAGRLEQACRARPDLVVLDHLTPQTLPAALDAARAGLWVISQLDTVFYGAGVARHLTDLGASRQQLSGLSWVLSVQRLATLCPACKQPALPDPARLASLSLHYTELVEIMSLASPLRAPKPSSTGGSSGKTASSIGEGERATPTGEIGTFYSASGCPQCQGSGRRGDLAVFDIFQADPGAPDPFTQPSRLAMQTYLLYLASLGELAIQDYLDFETDQFRRVYFGLADNKQRLDEVQASFERQLAEQDAAHRVLEQRTRALISLQEIAHSLISSADLEDLAGWVVRCAGELCGADRCILYYLLPDGQVEVLASLGWGKERLPPRIQRQQVFTHGEAPQPLSFPNWPPGISPRHPDVEGAELRAGLYIPLLAQDELVGLMVVHATRKPAFKPGEVALLQALTNQAALAIQRASLIEQLQAKVAALEAAQAELVEKERLERELELARQVQQSMLPKSFPEVAGFRFAARYEPARYVGGDLYDVILLDDDHFGIAIADVSDKGMPAALYMALTRSLLLAESGREPSPRRVLERINHVLIELGQLGMFVTVFYGVIELSTRYLTYASAGHDRPWLLRGGEARELASQGAPLGVLEEGVLLLTEERLEIETGDRLVLYTDGLADVESRDGRLYGRQRLRELVQDHAGQPPDELCAAVFAELISFQGGGDQFDDMAMLVVSVEGQA